MLQISKIYTQINKQVEKLKFIIEQREKVFNNRTERWQESDNGESYEELTQSIELSLNDIENANDELNNLINE